MDSIAQRIKELIDDQGLTNSEFAKKTDLNPAIISHILSGRNKPSVQVISSIKDVFKNVNINYIISGEGGLYGNVTNVNYAENTPSEPEQPSLITSTGFPMEGVRIASVPGTPAPSKQESETADKLNTDPPKQAEKTAATPSPHQEKATGKKLEQVILIYNDGTFKAYRP